MGNSTTFLPDQAYRLPISTQLAVFQRYVDFTVENVASGSSIDILKLQKGFVPVAVGWTTHTTDAQNPTFAISLGTLTTELKGATAIGAAGSGSFAVVAAPPLLTGTDDETIRVTVGAATCDGGKVTFFVIGYNNEQGQAA